MTKNITLAIDEDVLDEAQRVAAEQRTTVNAMVREFLQLAVARRKAQATFAELASSSGYNTVPMHAKETTHEKMVRLLNEGRAKYGVNQGSEREETYDRDYLRAEQYFENRAALLKLIDETTGDMGQQRWNREGLYDR